MNGEQYSSIMSKGASSEWGQINDRSGEFLGRSNSLRKS